jgi:hypothetical protein
MVYFQTKNSNLGKFLRALDWRMLIYFMAIWNFWLIFWIFYDHLAHFVFNWYIFPVLVSCTKNILETQVLLLNFCHFFLNTNASRPGGVAQWSLHPPKEQTIRVRIPSGYVHRSL